jgi:hypothetical protein
MMGRMKKFQAKNGISPGTILTTAALQEHENGGGVPGEAKIWICWQVRTFSLSPIRALIRVRSVQQFQARTSSHPKAIAAALGYYAKGWAVSKFMPGACRINNLGFLNHLMRPWLRYQSGNHQGH